MQATKTVRPAEIKSRLAHWVAKVMGCLSAMLAMQAGPILSFLVRAATAESNATASRRGLAKMLSPTQTQS